MATTVLDAVTWSVEGRRSDRAWSVWRTVALPFRVVAVLAGLVLAPSEALADLGSGHRGRRNAVVDPGSAHELALAPLLLRGPRGAFGGRRRWRAWTLRFTSTAVLVHDDPGMPAVAELSLSEWSLVEAHPRPRRSAGATEPGARWRGRLRRGTEEFTLEGEWLSWAWLGYLAGWADPSRVAGESG